MEVKWTKQALKGFNNIQSEHFTSEETMEYKKTLAIRIKNKNGLLGITLKADQPELERSYKVNVDKYIVYYTFSEEGKICNIEYFRHFRQNR